MGGGGAAGRAAAARCDRLRIGRGDEGRAALREGGEGYSDLEYAILRELGHPPVPVATTVHAVQIVDALPRDPTDLPLSLIVTPADTIRVRRPPRAPVGLAWERLTDEDFAEMPVLAEIRRLTGTKPRRGGKRMGASYVRRPPAPGYAFFPGACCLMKVMSGSTSDRS